MDPPEEEDVELASLMAETINDNNNYAQSDDDEEDDCRTSVRRGSDAPSSSSSSVSSFAPPPRRSQYSSSPRHHTLRQKQHQQSRSSSSAPTTTSSPSSSNKNDHAIFGFSSRNAILLLILAGFVLVLVLVASKLDSKNETDAASTTKGVAHHFDPATKEGGSSTTSKEDNGEYIGFHDASSENIYGANRYYKHKGVGYPLAPRGGLHPIYMMDLEVEDDSEKLPDLDDHEYYHEDYELSPYADKRLKLTDAERTSEQTEWNQKLSEIRTEYGYWNFRDDYRQNHKGKDRPVVNWSTVGDKKKEYNPLLGEIDPSDFPKDAWQTDDTYIANFLREGRSLIQRVQDGIYEEHGWERGDAQGGINIMDGSSPTTGGVAWMYEGSMKALVKKLLCAMMTNDHFFVTLGGHSAAAGHGNNFFQSYILEFQRVMEPVFDRLGMVLVSSNLAQGGMGTLQSAMAGVGIYNENDFMLWDSSMTEKDGRAQDVFMRQALLGGKRRVPILFDMGGGKGIMDKLVKEVGANVGGVTGVGLLPKFKNVTVNFAEKKYNAACWTDRSDMTPDVQYDKFGGQASWHPGNYGHQSGARKITLLFLHALDEALLLWQNTTTSGSGEGNPLNGKHWHLHADEDKIRSSLQSANATETECGKIFDFLPRVCTTPMRGAGEWTPRRDPYHSSIRSLAKAAPMSGYVPGIFDLKEQLYKGRDVHIPGQRIPWGEVDVAVIARSLPPRSSSGRRRRRSLVAATTNARHQRQTEHTASIANNSTHSSHSRHLDGESKIIPGEGWAVTVHPAGYCDGTRNSVCYREKTSHCQLSQHNDGRGVMKGDGLSGWLVLDLKDVTEGIFMARMEDYHQHKSNLRTEGWETVNNATKEDGDGRRRKLKAPPPPHPPTWVFEIAINGVIQSMNTTDFQSRCHYMSYNNAICLLWNDEERALKKEKEDVEFAMRLVGEGGRIAVIALTHIYYA